MTTKQILEYGKKYGKFPPGRARCMDCRCKGPGHCPGESIGYQMAWYRMCEEGL